MVYTNTVTNYDEFLKIFFLNERGLLVLKGERWLSVPWKTNTPPLVGVKKILLLPPGEGVLWLCVLCILSVENQTPIVGVSFTGKFGLFENLERISG